MTFKEFSLNEIATPAPSQADISPTVCQEIVFSLLSMVLLLLCVKEVDEGVAEAAKPKISKIEIQDSIPNR